jgi:hypothetical protein
MHNGLMHAFLVSRPSLSLNFVRTVQNLRKTTRAIIRQSLRRCVRCVHSGAVVLRSHGIIFAKTWWLPLSFYVR